MTTLWIAKRANRAIGRACKALGIEPLRTFEVGQTLHPQHILDQLDAIADAAESRNQEGS